jgi:hypothetical protein
VERRSERGASTSPTFCQGLAFCHSPRVILLLLYVFYLRLLWFGKRHLEIRPPLTVRC